MLRNTLVTLIAIIASLLVAESATRLFILSDMIRTGWGWRDSPLRHLRPMEVAEQPNQLGARGQPISYTDDEMVVLLVGDSQVEWPFGSLKEMPEALLQHVTCPDSSDHG